MSNVFIVLNVRDDTESKYPSIVFLSILFVNSNLGPNINISTIGFPYLTVSNIVENSIAFIGLQRDNSDFYVWVKSGNFGHQVNSDISLQTVEIQMRRLLMSRLIRIFTVCLVYLFFYSNN